jgi:hypothetical protein
MTETLLPVLLASCALAACGAPPPGGTDNADAPLTGPVEPHPDRCADGTIPGCGPCVPDSSSRTGFSEDCVTCTRETFPACTPTTVVKTPSRAWLAVGSMNLGIGPWDHVDYVNYPPQITYQYWSNTWHMTMTGLQQKVGPSLYIYQQAGTTASGTIDPSTGYANLSVPLHVVSSVGEFDVTVPISTDTKSGFAGASRYNGDDFSMVGTGYSTTVPGLGTTVDFALWLDLEVEIP